MESHATGEAGHWWLNESLKKLQESYRSRFGASLIILEGEALEVLQKLVKKYKINQVLWNRLYSSETIKRDTIIKKTFQDQGVDVETFNGHLLNEPWEVQNNSGQYFKVFTPYWRKAFEVYQSKKEKLEKLKSINVISIRRIIFKLREVLYYESKTDR